MEVDKFGKEAYVFRELAYKFEGQRKEGCGVFFPGAHGERTTRSFNKEIKELRECKILLVCDDEYDWKRLENSSPNQIGRFFLFSTECLEPEKYASFLACVYDMFPSLHENFVIDSVKKTFPSTQSKRFLCLEVNSSVRIVDRAEKLPDPSLSGIVRVNSIGGTKKDFVANIG